jgi:putative DNA-invertase from lambdoid prophage Rac
MTMGVINAVAQFERDLLVERTQSGLAQARAQGKRLGRPPSLDPARRADVLAGLGRGESLSVLARRHGTSRQTVMRLRDAELAQAERQPDAA